MRDYCDWIRQEAFVFLPAPSYAMAFSALRNFRGFDLVFCDGVIDQLSTTRPSFLLLLSRMLTAGFCSVLQLCVCVYYRDRCEGETLEDGDRPWCRRPRQLS